jgi:hypothetical protein
VLVFLSCLEKCYYDVPIADVAKKKPFGRINDVLIMVNNNLVPVDFLVMDVECNASCPIILGRSFLQRDSYFRAPGSLVVLSFPQPFNFFSVFPSL